MFFSCTSTSCCYCFMKNPMFIFLLQFILFVDSCHVMRPSENNTYNSIDSITTNFSQSNVTYYGIRIWPQDEEYNQKSVENRLYLVLGINDTLVVISDNPIFFGANILSIRSKSRARKVYSRYNLNFGPIAHFAG